MVSEVKTMTTDNEKERHPDFVPWGLILPIWGIGVLSGLTMTLLILLWALAAGVVII